MAAPAAQSRLLRSVPAPPRRLPRGVPVPAPAALARAGELVARPHRLPVGPWDRAADAVVRAQPALGLLVLSGVLLREVQLGGRWSADLLGAGDLLRPWDADEDEDAPVPMTARWTVLAPVTLAILDEEFLMRIGDRPQLVAHYVSLLGRHGQRLRRAIAIDHLSRVERRLLALFWCLADRWGRVTPDGVTIPLKLSHDLLGRLVGARRPTVSTATGMLDELGLLRRNHDGTWLLDAGVLASGDPLSVALPE